MDPMASIPSSHAMSETSVTSGTFISSRAVRAGQEPRFEDWVDRLQQAAQAAPGYLGAIQLRQTRGLQHVVVQFDTQANAQAWRDSPRLMSLSRDADAFSVGLNQVGRGDPARFEIPSDSSAVGWKRFVTTWAAVFPLLLAISTVMRWLLAAWPPILQLLPSSLILTAVLQWIVLPRLQRWSRIWVLEDSNGQLRAE